MTWPVSTFGESWIPDEAQRGLFSRAVASEAHDWANNLALWTQVVFHLWQASVRPTVQEAQATLNIIQSEFERLDDAGQNPNVVQGRITTFVQANLHPLLNQAFDAADESRGLTSEARLEERIAEVDQSVREDVATTIQTLGTELAIERARGDQLEATVTALEARLAALEESLATESLTEAERAAVANLEASTRDAGTLSEWWRDQLREFSSDETRTWLEKLDASIGDPARPIGLVVPELNQAILDEGLTPGDFVRLALARAVANEAFAGQLLTPMANVVTDLVENLRFPGVVSARRLADALWGAQNVGYQAPDNLPADWRPEAREGG